MEIIIATMYQLVILLIVILSSLLLFWIFVYCTHYRKIKNVISVTPIPLIGSFWLLRRPEGKICLKNVSLTLINFFIVELLQNSLKLINQYGSLFKGMGGFRTVIFSANANFNEYILNSREILRKSYTYDIAGEWLGEGLLTSSGTL